jgi:hypothetical protein
MDARYVSLREAGVSWSTVDFSGMQIELNDEAKERLAKAETKNLCVACMEPLDETRVVRGCHERCYRATMRSVANGKTTEAQRIAEGKLLVSEPGGGSPSNPVTKEIYAKQ